ncbi:MAG TPA: DNA mismatch repair protein MutS [Planctomycetota bacterium]
MHNPREVYAKRLLERREAAEAIRRIDERWGTLGLWSVSAAAVAFLLILLGKLTPVWLLPPIAAAVAFQILHGRCAARRRPLEFGIRFCEDGLARVEDRWIGKGREGLEFLDPEHPYAADLDLFGRGSLYERLCTTRTRPGEKTLAGWLLAPASPPDIRARQEAVAELRDRFDLREELALLAEDTRTAVNPDELSRWAAEPPGLPRGLRVWAWTVSIVVGVALFLGVKFFALALFLVLLTSWATKPRVARVAELAQRAERELDVLSKVLLRLEREPFASPKLAATRESLRGAAAAVGRLVRIVELLQSARNELVMAILGLFLWRLHVAYALEGWRAKHGASIPGWLEAAGEVDALGALAGYAWERPEDPLPEVVDAGPVYEGEGLGHPLLPERTCVRNDVRLGKAPAVLVVSGSNMSGKSTLLRTVGANAVLAMAGAPVRAKKLRMSILAVGATIRVQDSLQLGTSRFFAEVKRLKQLMDLAKGPRPLLFFLEELLSGTNSHDRQKGAEILVRTFVESGATGLVTTHDLSLAAVADALGERALNVHFDDRIVDGKLVFDYVLKPGPVKGSNALELMRAVGLPV